MANGLINLLTRLPPDERGKLCEEQHGWIRQQIDLVGGWLPHIDSAYRPKLVGAYRFDAPTSHALQRLAEAVGALFHALGAKIHDDSEILSPSEFWDLYSFLAIPPAYHDALDSLPTRYFSTPLIRPDVLLDKEGRPWIAEVNTGSVGGVEDLLIYLEYLLIRAASLSPEEAEAVRGQKARLLATLKLWLDRQYDLFLRRRETPRGRPFGAKPTICVVYADREDSFFVAKYLAAIFAHLGYRTLHCRPEHLRLDGDRLCVEAPVSREKIPIDIVYRDFIFEEMFAGEEGGYAFHEEFAAFLTAAQRELALVLNPLQDFLLRSKAAIPALYEEKAFDTRALAAARDRFAEFSPRTQFARPGLDFGGDMVLKPTLGHSGREVLTDRERVAAKLNNAPPEDLYPHWIVQQKVDVEEDLTLFALESGIAEQRLRCAHGLLIHNVGDGWRATGVLTKCGIGEVINFSGGAQLVPGLLHGGI